MLYIAMTWEVELHEEFAPEVDEWSREVQMAIAARIKLLEAEGPRLGRPLADTLKGSKHPNMKELRFDAADGVWRVAYAFDPERKGILLVGADKRGENQTRFYRRLIKIADRRFDKHLG
jgi:hypothetical protein